MDTPVTDQSYVVRYGVSRIVGEFSARGLGPLARGTTVIIRSDRGHEWGTVLSTATEQSRTYLGTAEEHGRIIRLTNAQDEIEHDQSIAFEKEAFVGGQNAIRERNLQMQLIDIERVFGGERLIFYYLAEDRVDFRELVKALAKQFQTRIEMRQIGIRDEAKLLADYGDCGQPVCCNTFLREMPPVSMKMAKLQKATLDPSKISGRCGRLKCCLRYEYDTYEEHRRDLPPIGATVVTKVGTGRIIGQELLARKLMIAYEGQRMVMTDEKDIVTVVSNKPGKSPPLMAADRDDAADSSDSPRREHRPQGEPRNEDRPRGDSNRRGGRGPRSSPPRSEGSGDSRDMPNPDRPV
ncbi:MAG: regulatory iron-sulfur-containing complex subunit RicT [Planctomycetota bacterium]